MKENQIEIGKTYIARVSSNVCRVKIIRDHHHKGWIAENLNTEKETHIKNAACLLKEVD